MKTHSTLIRRSFQTAIVLMSLVYFSSLAFAIEPIGTVGQPFPEQHAFLSNEAVVRVTPAHIQIIDTNTGAVIDEFAERRYFSDVVLSPDASHLAIFTHAHDGKSAAVGIWNVKAREQISEWRVGFRIYDVAAFSPTEPLFAIPSDDGVHLWNWQTGEFLGRMIGARRPLKSCYYYDNGSSCTSGLRDRTATFSPDGRYLIVASMRPDIELWNIETRQLEGHFEGHTGNWVEDVAISPDGRYIASFERGPTSVHVWDVESRQLRWKAQSGVGRISDVAFSPDSQHLYVTTETAGLSRSGPGPWEGWDDHVRVWNVKSGQQINTFSSEFRALKELTLSPNGKIALLHYWDAVVIWDIEKKRPLNVWADFHRDRFYDVVKLSPDGKTVGSASRYFIKIWDVASQQLKRIVSAEGMTLEGLAISPDGQRLAVGRDPWVEVRNLQTGNIEAQLLQPIGGLEEIVFSASGRWIATMNYWKGLSILDTKNPEKLQQLKSKNELASIHIYYQIVFSKNDEYFAASGRTKDNQDWIQLWKRQGDTFVFQYAWQVPELLNSPMPTLAFTSNTDGSTVLAASGDSELHIWKLLSDGPQLLTTLDGGYHPVHFSPDGRYLFARRDGYSQVWDWQTGTPLEHPSIPVYFDISRDGAILLSEAVSGQIHIWNGSVLLPSEPVAVEPGGKQIVILGAVKRDQLLQNFPNPFNPETWIPFRLTDESDVTIQIYSSTGQLVRRLSPGRLPAGDYSSQAQAVYWDGRNQIGESVSSGVYLYTIHAGDFSATRKMLIQK
ncbi:MAG: T9SS type A sorting domain-containing protein [Candidatus Poribacteria bacterium]|nr:T9SS type A sorting domain-containing protein [Candidatus Poribacteria bacterium]